MAKRRKPLPKTWQGARVVRGRGMKDNALTKLEENYALDNFIATQTIYLVVDDKLDQSFGDLKAFRNEAKAIRYAQALSNGNCDHRVLKVTEQILVVATENDL